MSVARLQDINQIEEMCTVDVIGQRVALKYGCTECVEPSGKCVQCVQVDSAGKQTSILHRQKYFLKNCLTVQRGTGLGKRSHTE